MKRISSAAVSAWVRLGISTGGLALAALGAGLKPAFAQTTTLPPLNVPITFQTSAPGRCANVGDWYTTNGNARATLGGIQQNLATELCLPTDPPGNQTTNPTANRLHRFVIAVTQSDLAAAGGSVTVSIEDAGTGGSLDEVDGIIFPFTAGPAAPVYDPTRFRLLGPNGAVIGSQTLTPQTNPTDIGRTIQFPPITQPGVYTITSETGEYAIAGYTGPFNLTLNNDDNGFRIVVNGVQDFLIGQFQGTFQNNANIAAQTFNFYFLVGPGTTDLLLRNFDLDSSNAPVNPGGENNTITYSSPTTAGIAGTVSGNAVWNGTSGTLNTGGDVRPVAGLANAGRWGIQLNGYGSNFTNQSLLEVNTGTQPNPGQQLPIAISPPTRAGNFIITPPSDRTTQIGQTVCHPFSVTNLFFTTDIINLSTTGTDPNYTVEFRDGDGTTVLTDTDGDGAVDTGILAAFGGTRNLNLCVTPKPGAPSTDNTTIVGISFMDQRIRQQAVRDGIPGAVATPQQQTVLKITRIGEGGGTGNTNANLLLVKRITNITRGGTALPGVNFGEVINDPTSANDDDSGWAQIPLAGIITLPDTNPVRSNDEVTYTVYFLSNGGVPALDVSICDLIPGGTTFIPNSLQRQNGNASPVSVGNFFTPLAPLPNNNSCPIQTNPNGATIVDLGTVSNTQGNNFGFIRFRVRVN